MVFVNSHIFYAAGPVIHRNVKVVDCTFQTVQTDSGFRFLQYVALDEIEVHFVPSHS